MKKRNNKGFTLAEILIVLAIVAVLAAIAIPSFSGQMEAARETADINAIRAAYSEAFSKETITYGTSGAVSSSGQVMNVSFVQKTNGWQSLSSTTSQKPTVGGKEVSTASGKSTEAGSHTVTFKFKSTTDGGIELDTAEISG